MVPQKLTQKTPQIGKPTDDIYLMFFLNRVYPSPQSMNALGVEEIMIGGIIETEASKIYHEGEAHGIAIGEARGVARKSERIAVRLHVKGHDPIEIADILEVDIPQVQTWIRNAAGEV